METPKWDACTLEPFFMLRWMECHPGVAGYLQVAGALLAVWIAYKAPTIAARQAKRQLDADRRAQTIHQIRMLATPVINVGVLAEKIEAAIEKQKAPDVLTWNDWFDKDIFMPLPEVLGFLRYATDLDEEMLAEHRSLVMAIQNYNSVRFQFKGMGFSWAQANWSQVRSALKEAIRAVRNAAEKISLIYVPPR